MNQTYKSARVKSSEITPYSQYVSRRDFLKAAGIVSGSALLAACAPRGTPTSVPAGGAEDLPMEKDELGDPTNSFEDITHYNNYYEFTTDKEGVAGLAEKFKPEPWTVQVYGLVNKPKTYAIEDL
jgi:sulfoxide reductase catalytic subunit YedY